MDFPMEATAQSASLRLCSRSFYAFALRPEKPLRQWLSELDGWLARAPEFFQGKSVVLDISHLQLDLDELSGLLGELSKREVRVLGVDTADPAHAKGDFAILKTGALNHPPEKNVDARADTGSGGDTANSTVTIQGPVRSGQSIVNNDGDVVVIGSVSSAAEVVAVGSIHIYGALRGRALAGALGNREARIFCRSMEAELIAIDGNYLLAEDLDPTLRKSAIQAWLVGSTLKITRQG